MASCRPVRVRAALLVLVGLLSTGAASALASTASEEQQGAALVKTFNAGDRSCSSLSADESERVGEYAMGLNFATVGQHDAMNRHMQAMMGVRGEELAHQAMGRAYLGCTRATGGRGNYGPGMMGGGYWSGGMMGGSPYGPGMTGRGRAGAARLANTRATNRQHDWDAGAVIAIAVLAAALAGGLVALVVTQRGRNRPAARTS